MLNLPYAMIEKVFLWSVAHFECRESDVYDIIVLVTESFIGDSINRHQHRCNRLVLLYGLNY